MYAKMMTTQALCDAIYTTVFRSEKPLSRLDICRSLGKKKSPHILKMIEHLHETGYFNRELVTDEFGRETFYYSYNAGSLEAACTEP